MNKVLAAPKFFNKYPYVKFDRFNKVTVSLVVLLPYYQELVIAFLSLNFRFQYRRQFELTGPFRLDLSAVFACFSSHLPSSKHTVVDRRIYLKK